LPVMAKPPPPPPFKTAAAKPEPPPVPAELAATEDYYWQHLHTGEQQGPSTLAQVKAAFERGDTNDDCLVYGSPLVAEWKTIGQVPVLSSYLKAKPKPPPGPPPMMMAKPPPPKPAAPASAAYQPAKPAGRPTNGAGARAGSVSDELAAKLAKRRAAAA